MSNFPPSASSRYSGAALLESSRHVTPTAAPPHAANGLLPASLTGTKRSAEALYNQSVPGTDNAGEDLFAVNSYPKQPRLETTTEVLNYPQRPGQKDCAHYMKTRTCAFVANCRFNHPVWVPVGGVPGWKEVKDIQTPLAGQVFSSMGQLHSVGNANGVAGGLIMPAFNPGLQYNSWGLPMRPGATDCEFYLKTSRCNYGAACRYNHPDISPINSQVTAGLVQPITPSPANTVPLGVLYAANLVPFVDPLISQTPIATSQTVYPLRPGQPYCDHYMKFGDCRFGEGCKYDHPVGHASFEQNVRLNPAGYPRREGAEACSFYMIHGACKFGLRCKFDHPEALPTVQENAAGVPSTS